MAALPDTQHAPYAWYAAAVAALLLGAASPKIALASTAAPGAGYYVYADVVDVRPLYRVSEISEPVRYCHVPGPGPGPGAGYQDVRYGGPQYGYTTYRHDEYRGQQRSGAGAGLVGALVGGLVGHQFGGGSGKKALTVAGAVLGASIASDHARRSGYREVRSYREPSTPVRRCSESRRTRQVRSVDGYDVTYRYQGQTFSKHVREHPGDVVRVHVIVEPAS